jgi:hypothetical protein
MELRSELPRAQGRIRIYYLAADEEAALLLKHQRPLEGFAIICRNRKPPLRARVPKLPQPEQTALPALWIDAFHTAPPLLSKKSSQ